LNTIYGNLSQLRMEIELK